MTPEPNYRELLVLYIEHVLEYEGDELIDKWVFPEVLSEQNIRDLRPLCEEAIERRISGLRSAK